MADDPFQIVGEIFQATNTASNANTTVTIPAGHMIIGCSMVERASHTVTGGVKVGTTSGATDVIAAQSVSSGTANSVSDASLLKKMFSASADQTLFIQPVTSWNSAVVDIKFYLVRGIT